MEQPPTPHRATHLHHLKRLRTLSLSLISQLSYPIWATVHCPLLAEVPPPPSLHPPETPSPLPSPLSAVSTEPLAPEAFAPETSAPEPPAPEPPVETDETELVPAATPDRQTLFEQVFGKPKPGQAQNVIIPWSINQNRQGEMGINIGADPNTISWNATSFLETLGATVKPELQAQLKILSTQGPFSPETLKTLNIETQFNPQDLTLNIVLTPAQLRTNVVTTKSNRNNLDSSPTVNPAKISGYVNMRGNLGWNWISERDETGRQPLALSWDGVMNLNGWVLEGRADFTEDGTPRWRRGDLRLTHDWPTLAMRASAGEISTPTTGYQRGQAILGLSAARQFGIQPDRITRPISTYEFFLEAPSEVEIYINGDKDRTLDLPAGTQDLRDLSLGAGVNDIELVITDPVGRVQRLQFFAPTASQLLAPGLQQFAYSFGVPVTKDGETRIYNWDDPLLTASHRWGLSNTLTSGAYLQARLNQQLLGWDGAWATTLGSFDWDLALSRDPSLGLGYAGKLNYNYRRAGDTHNRALGLGLEYRSPDFLSVGEAEANNDTALEARLTYSQTLFEKIRANLGARYQWGRGDRNGDRNNAYRLNLGLSRPIGPGRNLGITLSHEQREDGSTDNQAKVNFSMSFSPRQGQTMRLSTDADLGGFSKQQINWNYNPRAAFNSIKTGATLNYTPEDWDVNQRMSWQGHRAQLELQNKVEGNTGSWLDPASMESNLTFGSAIAFADGHWGFSRPINGSFALLVPHPTLKDIDVEINPSRSGAAATIDTWGAAILPGLSEYRLNTVNLDAPELPLGYSLGRSSHRLRPSYRRGTLITVGNDATVFLRGILQTAEGTPLELATGEVIALNDPHWKPITLFTNRVGKFALEGFKPGRYTIRLTSGEQLEFTIPETATGVYNLDILKVPAT